jgi:hypothetical protein
MDTYGRVPKGLQEGATVRFDAVLWPGSSNGEESPRQREIGGRQQANLAFKKLVPQARLERATRGLGNRCSVHLSYWGLRLDCTPENLSLPTARSRVAFGMHPLNYMRAIGHCKRAGAESDRVPLLWIIRLHMQTLHVLSRRAARHGRAFGLATTDKGHFGRHYREELDVGIKWKARHVYNRPRHFTYIHRCLWFDRAVGLWHASGGLCCR